jgi:hypothetical protein
MTLDASIGSRSPGRDATLDRWLGLVLWQHVCLDPVDAELSSDTVADLTRRARTKATTPRTRIITAPVVRG